MEELKPVKSGKVKVGDVNLYYELYGAGDPLVLVAGTGISLAPWRVSQVPEFAKHYQVLIYDHRGLGRSDKPDMHYTTRLFAKGWRTLSLEEGVIDRYDHPKWVWEAVLERTRTTSP